MSNPDDRPFPFLHTNRRAGKPRKTSEALVCYDHLGASEGR